MPEKAMETHSSTPAWKILWTEEPGGLQSMGSLRIRYYWGAVLRWQRNRMGRSLSPSQIPQKNISTLNKLHKTTSECWQRTSGNQKSRPLSSKTGRKKYKRWEMRQRRWGGSSILGREARPGKGILRREVSKHQIGRAHVWTPVTDTHLVCRLLLGRVFEAVSQELWMKTKYKKYILGAGRS